MSDKRGLAVPFFRNDPPGRPALTGKRRRIDTIPNKNYNAVLMKLLGAFETLLLLAILRLDDRAYGVTIRRELLDHAGKDVAVGAIYTGLDRLEQKGFVKSWLGDPTAERGGKAKKFYRLTAQGRRALSQTHRAIERMSRGLEGSLTHA